MQLNQNQYVHNTSLSPRNSNSKIADINKAWTYSLGAYPKLDAALEQHAAAYGTIWSPHLLGPAPLSFADFLRTEELMALCPVGSDARFVLGELQGLGCFGGSRGESKRALTQHIKQSALFQRCGSFRYVQRIFNSIWRNYDGLLAAKQANHKALMSLQDTQLRADERRSKDAARKAAARSNDSSGQFGKVGRTVEAAPGASSSGPCLGSKEAS
jgi:hypothetical protein